MAGIKHGMWGMPPGERPNQTGNPQIDQAEWQKNLVLNQQALCKLCGNNIHAVAKDEFGKGTNFEWELANQVHTHCYYKYVEQLRNGQNGPQP